MRLLLGGPGSGKTTRVLSELRREGAAPDVRLVVPVATMAEHLRNRLAREGAGVRPSSVVTLAALSGEIVPGIETADAACLTLLTRMAVEEVRPRAFAALTGSPGLAPALAGAIQELANAGCDALQWEAAARLGANTGQALAEVYNGVEARLGALGLKLRPGQLAAAAWKAKDSGTGIRKFWFDGFITFSRGEMELIRALREHADVTVTLPEWEGASGTREELLKMGLREERLARVRPDPRVTLIAGATREKEAGEAALRLLEERRKGRAWHEMGIVIRSPQPYAGLLETTLRRAGIPVRTYFAAPLSVHPTGRFLRAMVEAALSGWEGERTIRALRCAISVSGTGEPADELDFRLREELPFSGLTQLRKLAGKRMPPWEEMDGWGSEVHPPAEWARKLKGLARFVALPQAAGPFDKDLIDAWRGRAAALHAWASSLQSTASALPPEPMLLEGFWKHAAPALDDASVRVQETKRDGVHLLDAVEARQWELKVVIVCGLLEGEFPSAPSPDPVLGEDLRHQLRRRGVMVRTRQDRELEEAFLLEMALSRATEEMILTWPAHDEQGRPTLRAFALDHVKGEHALARGLEIEPGSAAVRAPRRALQAEDLRAALRQRHVRHRPTALEVFLQCPFRFHAEHNLKLEEPPGSPAERLDGMVLGTLIHHVIAEYHRGQGRLEELFDREWARMLRKHRIPPSHRVEVARLQLLRSLRFYEQDQRIRAGWGLEVEVPLTLQLDGTEVSGRADRVDTSPAGECVVYDFKYSSDDSVGKKLKKQNAGLLIQGGIYLAALRAAGRQPAGFYFAGLRGGTSWRGSEKAAEVDGWIASSLDAASGAITRIYEGDISVSPEDKEACSYCAFLDACRIQEGQWKTQTASSTSS